MKAMLLPFGVFLALGLVGGVAGTVVRLKLAAAATPAAQRSALGARPPAAKADSAKPSAIAKAVDSTSVAVGPRPSADTTATHAKTAPPPATPATPPVAEGGGPTAEGAAPKAAPTDTAALAAERRLGKVLGSMPPKDAARVLGTMGDAEAARALSLLKEKQAAAILASLPTERAASMLRAGLRGGTK